MGKAQGAPNAFLLCSVRERGDFWENNLRFYLFFGKEEQNHSSSNHIGHSASQNSGAVTCHASQLGISRAVSPRIFMDLFKGDAIF